MLSEELITFSPSDNLNRKQFIFIKCQVGCNILFLQAFFFNHYGQLREAVVNWFLMLRLFSTLFELFHLSGVADRTVEKKSLVMRFLNLLILKSSSKAMRNAKLFVVVVVVVVD